MGIWKYYSNEWRGSSTLIRTEEYLDDGTVLKKDMWLGHTLAFNRGDSIPYQVVTQLGDSVQISCGKETIRFSVADELIIEPFDKNRLQFEIERVALNCYDRRIKLAATKAGK